MLRRGRWILAGALLLGPGCSCRDEVVAVDDTAETSRAIPPNGERLEVTDGRVHLAVDDALALSVLERLALAAGFELDVVRASPRRVTVALDGVLLEQAIAALVGDGRFSLDYVYDPATGRHRIATVHVGGAPARAERRAERPRRGAEETSPEGEGTEEEARRLRASDGRIDRHREELDRLREDLGDASDESYQRRLRSQIAEERRLLQQELRRALDDPDPALRAGALEDVDTEEGGARDKVADLGQNDPDPGVRAAAAEALGDDGTYEAVTTLLRMLEDSDPRVLVKTIEALDFVGDESLVGHVRPFTTHRDTAVREAARDFVDSNE